MPSCMPSTAVVLLSPHAGLLVHMWLFPRANTSLYRLPLFCRQEPRVPPWCSGQVQEQGGAAAQGQPAGRRSARVLCVRLAQCVCAGLCAGKSSCRRAGPRLAEFAASVSQLALPATGFVLTRFCSSGSVVVGLGSGSANTATPSPAQSAWTLLSATPFAGQAHVQTSCARLAKPFPALGPKPVTFFPRAVSQTLMSPVWPLPGAEREHRRAAGARHASEPPHDQGPQPGPHAVAADCGGAGTGEWRGLSFILVAVKLGESVIKGLESGT